MKYYYFIVEGVHDVQALIKMLKTHHFTRINKKEDVPTYWHPLIPKNYPYEGDLTRPMPTPFFLKEAEGNRSIAIMNAGGEGNFKDSLISALFQLDVTLLESISLFMDADRKTADDKIRDFSYKLIGDPMLEQVAQSIKSWRDGITINNLTFRFYVFPNNESSGELEDLLLDGGELVYDELLRDSSQYIEKVKNSRYPYVKDKYFGKAKEKKMLFGVTANIFRAGKANQVSIQDNDWICSETIETVEAQRRLNEFLKETLHL